MDMKKAILYIYTETPMHVGTGVGLGAVDLPIQREKHTNYPIIQASGVKGALRDTVELGLSLDDMQTIFGGASGAEDDGCAGAVSPSDARILLFPVRALNSVFVWITAWSVLARFAEETGITEAVPGDKEDDVCVSASRILVDNKVMLEEFTYDATVDGDATRWAAYLTDYALPAGYDYWKRRLNTHLVVLPESEFRDFVRYSTDIVTRIHLDNTTKTVQKGQLFSRELLPADCLMYSSIRMTDSPKAENRLSVQAIFDMVRENLGTTFQIGGDETLGRGRVQLNWQEV